MALYNKHGVKRICTRCKDEDATTRVKSEWIGPACLAKRKERQYRERMRQKTAKRCDCGQTIPQHRINCFSCEEKIIFAERINSADHEELLLIVYELARKMDLVL